MDLTLPTKLIDRYKPLELKIAFDYWLKKINVKTLSIENNILKVSDEKPIWLVKQYVAIALRDKIGHNTKIDEWMYEGQPKNLLLDVDTFIHHFAEFDWEMIEDEEAIKKEFSKN